MWLASEWKDEGFCFVTNKQKSALKTLDMRFWLLDEEIQDYYFDSLSESPWIYILNTGILNFDRLIISGSSEIKHIQTLRGYDLTKPLELHIYYEDDHVCIENEELNLWGEGSSLKEAQKSFEDFFFHELKLYEKTPAKKMDFFAREKLNKYKNLLKNR